ncbi:MAG: nickel pincer cofactor biosynthesis protein LarC [Endomicrobiales bacterium]|nr:nickel pincer cofactor biosynthesis protein LarC [Endomicrobiales bacterium]
MKTAYFNCSSGIAGDMVTAALIDAGVSKKALVSALKKALAVRNWDIAMRNTIRGHFPAKYLTIRGDRHLSLREMKNVFKKSRLPQETKERSLRILYELIDAEAKVHGTKPGKVHFHEMSSVDTVIDVAASCLALRMTGARKVYSSPVNVGSPAPAAIEIIKKKKIPVYSGDVARELATPTGIAIISHLADGFGPMPLMSVEKSGAGAGTADTGNRPNILRVFIGKAGGVPPSNMDNVVLLETNIDDMDPRIFPYVLEKLLESGARDAWLTQLIMKKGRPGTKLSVICVPETEAEISGIIFKETTTLGIRRFEISRHVLKRRELRGEKRIYLPGGRAFTRREFETAKKMSDNAGEPILEFLD